MNTPTRLRITSTFIISLLVANVVYAQGKGSNGQPFQALQDQIDALTQRLDALESGLPVSTIVDCSAGETVSSALASVPGSTPIEITINGMCAESVFITRDDVILQGSSPADGISGLSFINAPGRITISNLTIDASSGPWAVGCFQGSSVYLQNVEIMAGQWGVFAVDGGQCRLVDSNISGGNYGLFSLGNSLIDVEGNSSVTQANLEGVRATQGANIRLQTGTVVSDNGIGVVSTEGSHISISGLVANNTGDGIQVKWGGTARVDSNASVENNGGNGITLDLNSTMTYFSSGAVTNNAGWGVQCSNNSGYAGGLIASGNGAGDYDCP